jgi:hypothetical protein
MLWAIDDPQVTVAGWLVFRVVQEFRAPSRSSWAHDAAAERVTSDCPHHAK